MSSGGNYVAAPANPYETVAAYGVDSNITVPSGARTIEGAYFAWDSNGFTGKGSWFLGQGPMVEFSTAEEVEEYINGEGAGTLNGVFSKWAPSYDEFMNFADNFRTGGAAAGCADFNAAD